MLWKVTDMLHTVTLPLYKVKMIVNINSLAEMVKHRYIQPGVIDVEVRKAITSGPLERNKQNDWVRFAYGDTTNLLLYHI